MRIWTEASLPRYLANMHGLAYLVHIGSSALRVELVKSLAIVRHIPCHLHARTHSIYQAPIFYDIVQCNEGFVLRTTVSIIRI